MVAASQNLTEPNATAARRCRRPAFRAGPWVMAGMVLALFLAVPLAGFLSLGGKAALAPLTLSQVQVVAIRDTALLLFGVSLVAGSIGILSAWLVTMFEFPGRRFVDVALVLPLALPTYLAAFVAVDLLTYFGPVQTLWRAIIGAKSAAEYRFFEVRSLPGAAFVIGLVVYPYVYLPCRMVFARNGRSIIDAGRMLGASGNRLFWRVGLPLARPAMIGGLTLALLETLNDIGATEHLGITSLSVAIRDLWLTRGDLAGATRLAGVLLALVALLLILEARKAPLGASARSQSPSRPMPLSSVKRWTALVLTLCPVLVAFAVPTMFLITRAVQYARPGVIDGEFLSATASSVMLALAVAGLVSVIGAMVAIAARLAPALRVSTRLMAIGYAIPGTVLVLALFPVFRAFDSLAQWLMLPLSVSGTMVTMLFALSVRFGGIGAAQAGLALARLSPTIDAVAKVHGMAAGRLALRVHLPSLAPGLKFGALLVFIDTIKELPATLLLRPLNFETLATRAYAEASAGQFEQAALESLAILAASGLAAVLVVRRAD